MPTKNCFLFQCFLLALAACYSPAYAVDGHELWLSASATSALTVHTPAGQNSPTLELAKQALINGWQNPESTSIKLKLSPDKKLSNEGFSLSPGCITAKTDKGLLYGAYEYLRRQQTGAPLNLPYSNPSYQRRLLNHWDNLDGSVERGYAGRSIFWKGNEHLEPTVEDKERWQAYARANASVGINGAVLNNVNASPAMLSLPILQRAAAIANELRPYGMTSYLSINFSTPMQLGGLNTADPLDQDVIDWWRAKIREIYTLIPDFGGFLVKANSEGLPGPQDFGRSHAEGANMLAGLLRPYGGIVMWRAFVYRPDNTDRAKQAYEEFTPLDGQFNENVIIQVKNGPIDFQPREPFSPLFGALQKTALMPELQITQEYLGQEHQLAFLAGLWEECLQSDSYQSGPGSTVAKCTDGTLFDHAYTAIAGVSNIGTDNNWCGHPFAAANWYAFGRLAWNNDLPADQIAEEWLKLSFKPEQANQQDFVSGKDSADWEEYFLKPVLSLMLESREVIVNYMMPMGLHHLFALDHHYGPGPWYTAPGQRKDWTPPYYHQADAYGLGFDRSSKGSNAVEQYREPLRSMFNNPATCPENLLLWFHHLPWQHRMQNGRSLWEELCWHYDSGVQEVRRFRLVWDGVKSRVDSERFELVQAKLKRQAKDAQVWKDACLLYFQSINQLPFPENMERPVHDLEVLKKADMRHFLFEQFSITNQAQEGKNYFPIVDCKSATTIFCDDADFTVVKKASSLFAADIEMVSGKKPALIFTDKKLKDKLIIIGTIGNNALIDRLISEKKIIVDSISDQWERFIIQTIDKPFKGVSKALVIAGSDKRGTAYGVFTLSEAMGVSPWYYWADVPVTKSKTIYIGDCHYQSKTPTIKYRGIFLNDEDWGLQPWAAKNIDTEIQDIGPKTYERIFELLLRLKANMVAPAMHECTKAFYTVQGNMEMADKYGILITTSHCEPLLYNNASEWDKEKQGAWNYVTNKKQINKALENRVKQAHANENIYTIALRGMHDEGMKGGSDEEKLKTLDEAIKDQRVLLKKYITKPIHEIPQIFVPYKEVLGLYEKGLEVPEDITIVWPDDNYGYIKKLSNTEEQQRKGGSGVYYHISYLGWPNDYLWINTTPPALMYAEMHKAYSLGADKYWLLNVGDIKPGEMGIQLFLNMAWDMEQFSFENINSYQVKQLSSIFGKVYEKDIAQILDRYYYHGFIRKPEYMTWDWRWNSLFALENVKDTEFSFINYNEAEKRLKEYNEISQKAESILNQLPQELKAAFFELIYYPVKGASLYNHEMLTGQKNRWYAQQHRALTNTLADHVKLYHDSLATLTARYNNLLHGKWNAIMTAPGFLPKLQLSPTKKIDLPEASVMKIFVEAQPNDSAQNLLLPEFNKQIDDPGQLDNSHFFEVYNAGNIPFKWTANANKPWIKLDISEALTKTQTRVQVSIDWSLIANKDSAQGEIIVTDGNSFKNIHVTALNPQQNLNNLFVENNGVISINPAQYHRKTENANIKFQLIKGLGYCNSSLQLGNARFDSGESSFVEYDFYTSKPGEATIYTYMLPLFPKDKAHGTSYGIQIDDLQQTIQSNNVKEYSREWAGNVVRNSAINSNKIFIPKAGKHTLKIYSIDPGMILQKIVIDLGGLKDSYISPRETYKKGKFTAPEKTNSRKSEK